MTFEEKEKSIAEQQKMEVSRKLEKPVENSNLLAVNSIVQINTESYNKDQKVIESNVKKSMKKSDMVQSKVLQSKKSENVVITIEEAFIL